MKRLLMILGVLVLAGGIGGGVLYHLYPAQVSRYVALSRNAVLSWNAPAGSLTTEVNPDFRPATPAGVPSVPAAGDTDWPSYNRTLTSERYSPLGQIDVANAGKLKVLCSYDTGQLSSFQSGLLMVEGTLVGTTYYDIFALDPVTCAERWRAHEDDPANLIFANRGAAYLDGLLFRGTGDGRVLTYEFATGKRVWETRIADPARGESVPAAPIAWNGLVFVGNAGGDFKGGKGQMYALEAKTGKIVWQFFLAPRVDGNVVRGPLGASPLDTASWPNPPGVPISGAGSWTSFTLDPEAGLVYVPGGNPSPDYDDALRDGGNLYTDSLVVLDARSGDYRKHFKLVPKDWHDWDVSNPPTLVTTAGGRQLLALSPKDGHLYGFDRATDRQLYRVPVTRIENVDQPFAADKPVFFCPGPVGGGEWNGPAYDPRTNLILVPEVEWCFTVEQASNRDVRLVPLGQPWTGAWTWNPFDLFGKPTSLPHETWAGWVQALDADTGVWAWRAKSNYPIVSGVTPTAGGVAFFADVGGNFYVVDAADGHKLWGQKLGGAIGGGPITYAVDGKQWIAVAVGFTSLAWPTEVVTGKVVVLGLGDAAPSQ